MEKVSRGTQDLPIDSSSDTDAGILSSLKQQDIQDKASLTIARRIYLHFYRIFLRQMRREVKARLRVFNKLKTIPINEKQEILTIIRRAEIINVKIQEFPVKGKGILYLIVVLIALLLGLLFGLPIVFLAVRSLDEPLGNPNFVLLTIISVTIVAHRAYFRFSLRASRHDRARSTPLNFLILPSNRRIILTIDALYVLGYIIILISPIEIGVYKVYAAIGITLIGVALISETSFLFSKQIFQKWEYKQKGRFIISLVLHDLIDLLHYLEKHRLCWYTEADSRKEIIQRLESIGFFIEAGFPTYLQFGGNYRRRELEVLAKEIADGIRSLSYWVYIPKEDTNSQLRNRIALIITLIAKGNWDGLPRVPYAPFTGISRRKAFIETSKVVITTIILAGLPIGVVMFLRQADLMDESAIKPALLGGLVWAGLIILNKVDPLLGGKLTSFKEISNMLPLPFKKAKDE